MLRVFPFAPKTPREPRVHQERASCDLLLAAAVPTLYLENPFRRLGLSALATPREVLRRVDELKLSLELGTASTPWAFAPDREITVAEIRDAAQKLKSPRERLIAEFFWFWPESYPLSAPDEALAALDRGETLPALDVWLRRAEEGSRVAYHNLAVYHHLLALDWEQHPEAEACRLPEVWPQALQYWQRLADDEPLWMLLAQRVERISDAQLSADFVAALRSSLPAAIAKINATLLILDAEHGRNERVALHASLINLIHRDGAGVRRTLEASAAPLARRIDSFVATARLDANDESVPALSVARALIQNCDADLRLVETLCGGEEAYTELSSSVADAALTCLVTHQRRTDEDQPCLTPLVYLLNMTVTPELRQRLEETYDVIRGNVGASASGEDPNNAASELARDHRMIAGIILPQLDTLLLSPAGRFQFTSRLAEWLEALANAAWPGSGELALADAVLATASTLPCEPVTRARLEARRKEIEPELLRQKKSLWLERTGHVLAVNAEGVSFDDQRLPLTEITGLRYGTTTDGGTILAWCSEAQVFELDSSAFFSGDTAAADYAAVVASFAHFVVPELVARLVAAVRHHATILIGETSLSTAGLGFPATAPDVTEDPVPYLRLEHRENDGFFILTDVENPVKNHRHALSEVWNAVVAGSVIDELAGGGNPVSP
jgi:hypothetical protein